MTLQTDPPAATSVPRDAALISYYEALESASEQMLAAARAGDWDRVAAIEAGATGLIEQLRARLLQEPVGARDARARLRIMRRIVLNDAEVRCLAQPWLRGIAAILAGTMPPPSGGRLH